MLCEIHSFSLIQVLLCDIVLSREQNQVQHLCLTVCLQPEALFEQYPFELINIGMAVKHSIK